MSSSVPILQVQGLKVYFPIRRGVFGRQTGVIKAVDGVTFDVGRGETVGVVGESGCGKTTTGRAILQLQRPTAGSVIFGGQDLGRLKGGELRRQRRNIQMIFQDPYGSLNPRLPIGATIGEPLRAHRIAEGEQLAERVRTLLKTVGLDPAHSSRYPHEFSGGQRQRVGIARALASSPTFLVCDEPISSLDVSIRAQIVNLLEDLQSQFGLTYLLIAHDLSMVRHLCDRVIVMYLGRIVELADKGDLYAEPLHPYTAALLSAAPIPDPRLERQREAIVLEGDIPSPAHPPGGCRFRTRCPLAIDICREQDPELLPRRSRHLVACHRVDEAGPGTGLPDMKGTARVLQIQS